METSVLMKAIREDPLDAQESTFPFGEPWPVISLVSDTGF